MLKCIKKLGREWDRANLTGMCTLLILTNSRLIRCNEGLAHS
jgi:hypothetical protein